MRNIFHFQPVYLFLIGVQLLLYIQVSHSICHFSNVELNALKIFYDDCNGNNWKWNESAILMQYEKLSTLLQLPYLDEFNNDTIESLYQSYSALEFNITEYSGIHWNFTHNNPNPCVENWKGIVCNNTIDINKLMLSNQSCHVTSLVLPRNGITCEIPSVISDLKYLIELFLGDNDIYGSIPVEYTTLSYLRTLSMPVCYIYGELHKEIAWMPSLEALILYGNALYGNISPYFFSSKTLNQIDLGGNLFNGSLENTMRNVMNSIYNLKSISLFNNFLSGPVPNQLCNYTMLEIISLGGNMLTGTIPSCFGQLKDLELLSLGRNIIVGTLPTDILIQLSSLIVLDLQSSFLVSSIPSTLYSGFSSKLEYLFLGDNYISGSISSSIDQLRSIRIIDFSHNLLNETIPIELYTLTTLQSLNLYHTYINDRIRPNISNLQNLIILSLAHSAFYGPIPVELGQLTMLRSIYLSQNFFTGYIPDSIGNIIGLRQLYLGYNHLVGSIPSNIYNLLNIIELVISSNPLSYSLPNHIPGWKRLSILSLSNSGLYGNLNPIIALSNLYEVQVGQNLITGTIPSLIGNLKNLSIISFNQNMLYGSIPTNINKLSALQQLLLYDNQLSGNINNLNFSTTELNVLMFQYNNLCGNPTNLLNSLDKSVSTLSYLDISHNSFTGEIPLSIGRLTSLKEIHLGVNCFHGHIPDTICNVTNIQVVSVDGLTSSCEKYLSSKSFSDTIFSSYFVNYMSGSLPTCIWLMPNINTLKLSGNGLTGTIPNIPSNSLLINISASYNQLHGTIPKSLQTLRLQYVDLSYNQLNGTITGFEQNSYLQKQAMESNNSITIYLNSNRLSGFIPDYFTYIRNMNILVSNIFDCSSKLPQYDPNYNVYLCGSRSFNQAMIAFCSILGFMLVVGLLLYYIVFYKLGEKFVQLQKTIEIYGKYILRPYKRIWKFHDITKHYIIENPTSELSLLLLNLRALRKDSIILTSFIIIFGGLCYPLMKQYNYGTVTYQYGWIVTAAFLAGEAPAGVILVLYALIITIMSRQFIAHREAAKGMSNDYYSENERFHPNKNIYLYKNSTDRSIDGIHTAGHPNFSSSSSSSSPSSVTLSNPMIIESEQSSQEVISKENSISLNESIQSNQLNIQTRKISRDSSFWSISSVITYHHFITFITYTSILIINIAIVGTVNIIYAILFITVTQSYEIILIRFAVSLFQLGWEISVVPNMLTYVTNDAPYRPQRLCLYNTIVFVLNSIIIPCVASLISLDYCFKSLFIHEQTVSSIYTWVTVTVFTVLNDKIYISNYVSQGSTFSPPFIYSGQCSSGVLIAYIPVYIIIYIFQIVLVPLTFLILSQTKFESYPVYIQQILPPIVWPENRSLIVGFPLKTGNITASIMLDIGTLITFGTMCPPLVFVICVGIFSRIYTKEVLIGRYIYLSRKQSHRMTAKISGKINTVQTSHSISMSTTSSNINTSTLKGTGIGCSNMIKISRGVSKRIEQAILSPIFPGTYIPNSNNNNSNNSNNNNDDDDNDSRNRNRNYSISSSVVHFGSDPRLVSEIHGYSMNTSTTSMSTVDNVINVTPPMLKPNDNTYDKCSSNVGCNPSFSPVINPIQPSSLSDTNEEKSINSSISSHLHSNTIEMNAYKHKNGNQSGKSVKNLIYLEFSPLQSLEMASRGMWRSPTACLGPLYIMSFPFFILVAIDIGGNQAQFYYSNTMIGLFVAVGTILPLLLYVSIMFPSWAWIRPAVRSISSRNRIELVRPSQVSFGKRDTTTNDIFKDEKENSSNNTNEDVVGISINNNTIDIIHKRSRRDSEVLRSRSQSLINTSLTKSSFAYHSDESIDIEKDLNENHDSF